MSISSVWSLHSLFCRWKQANALQSTSGGALKKPHRQEALSLLLHRSSQTTWHHMMGRVSCCGLKTSLWWCILTIWHSGECTSHMRYKTYCPMIFCTESILEKLKKWLSIITRVQSSGYAFINLPTVPKFWIYPLCSIRHQKQRVWDIFAAAALPHLPCWFTWGLKSSSCFFVLFWIRFWIWASRCSRFLNVTHNFEFKLYTAWSIFCILLLGFAFG